MQSAEQAQSPRIHFYNLDVLRFIAAFLIVIVHGYNAVLGWTGIPEPLRNNPEVAIHDVKNLNAVGLFLHRLIENFSLGVEFFFLISGFLITYLLLTELKSTGKIHIPHFYIRRLLRIWPLYFLILALTPIIVNWTDFNEPHYWWNIFFVNNYIAIKEAMHEPGLAHYWTICVEEHFYLAWPILLFFTPNKKMPVLFASIILLSIVSRWYYFATNDNWYIHSQLNTICRIDTMAIGGWFAWLAINKPFQLKISGWIRAMVYVVLIFLICFDDSKQTESYFLVGFKRLVYTSFFCFWLLNYLFNPNAWCNFKKKNVLHYFGKISFGLYMYHNILFPILFKKIIWEYHLDGFWWFWLIYISLVFALSIVSYELIEKPILKWKDRFAVVRTTR